MSDMNKEQNSPIRIWLSCRKNGETFSVHQPLPATRDELLASLAHAGIAVDSLPDLVVTVRDAGVANLAGRLPRNPGLDELNHLAHRIEGMGDYEREVFWAVMQANQHCGSLTEIINVAENLDRFDLYPGTFGEREFGGIMLEMHANEHSEVFERLRASGDPQEKSFASYVERLESSLDLVKYGRIAREDDNGVLTGSGYLLLPDEPLPERYTGPKDIPAEHRLTALTDISQRKPSLLAALKAAKAQCKAAARPDAPEKKLPSGPEL